MNNCTDGIVIAPGSYCQVAVTMKAPHAGTFSGTITFTSTSLNTTSTTQTVALSGFVYGVYAIPSPTSLTLASQAAHTTSVAKPVTLTNRGDLYSALFGTPVPSSSAFNVELGTCTAYIAVGASCKLNVTFSPALVQPYTGTVTIPVTSSGGGTTPSVTFNVSGAGTYVQLIPANVNFGDQPENTTSLAKTIKLTNKGSVTVNITGRSFTGADIGDFAETDTCGTSVASGKSCVFNVTFTPLATGIRTAQLAVSDDGGGSPQTVNLTGTGTP